MQYPTSSLCLQVAKVFAKTNCGLLENFSSSRVPWCAKKSNRSLNEPADSRVLYEQRGSLHFRALFLHLPRAKLVGELDELRKERPLVFVWYSQEPLVALAEVELVQALAQFHS